MKAVASIADNVLHSTPSAGVRMGSCSTRSSSLGVRVRSRQRSIFESRSSNQMISKSRTRDGSAGSASSAAQAESTLAKHDSLAKTSHLLQQRLEIAITQHHDSDIHRPRHRGIAHQRHGKRDVDTFLPGSKTVIGITILPSRRRLPR